MLKRKYTEQEKEKYVKEYQKSGLSRRQYAKRKKYHQQHLMHG